MVRQGQPPRRPPGEERLRKAITCSVIGGRRLARLRRMLLRFQRLLAPEPAAMFGCNRPFPAWMDRAVVRAFSVHRRV